MRDFGGAIRNTRHETRDKGRDFGVAIRNFGVATRNTNAKYETVATRNDTNKAS